MTTLEITSMRNKNQSTTRISSPERKPPKSLLSTRKQPTQKRGQLTFDAILDAAGQLLIERGYLRMTTNAVAERSGVSIGSLYQYFGSKQGLILSLHERHVRHVAKVMQASFAEAKFMSLAEGVAHNIAANFRAHRQERALHQALALAEAHVAKLRTQTPRAQVVEIIVDQLRRHQPARLPDELVAVAEVVFEAIEAVCHRAVVDQVFQNEQRAQDVLTKMIVLIMESETARAA